jgi:hypothetical protein
LNEVAKPSGAADARLVLKVKDSNVAGLADIVCVTFRIDYADETFR